MTKSAIQRTVHGDPGDPNSTRDLSGITAPEFEHLELAVKGGISEAAAFQKMDDDLMVGMLQNANEVNAQFDMPGLDLEGIKPDEMRSYFSERQQVLTAFLDKLQKAPGKLVRKIKGITPKEFEHLVTSVQAGVREAVVFSQAAPEQARAGISQVKAMYASWNLPAWDHYDPYLQDLPEFFQKRADLLYAVLEVINQPYPGYGPEDVERKLAESATYH